MIGPNKSEPSLCEAHRRLVELKIRVTRDLTDLLNRSGNVEDGIRGRSRAPGRGIPFAAGQSTLRQPGAGEQEEEKKHGPERYCKQGQRYGSHRARPLYREKRTVIANRQEHDISRACQAASIVTTPSGLTGGGPTLLRHLLRRCLVNCGDSCFKRRSPPRNTNSGNFADAKVTLAIYEKFPDGELCRENRYPVHLYRV